MALAGEDQGAPIGQSAAPERAQDAQSQVAQLIGGVSQGMGTIFEVMNQLPEVSDQDKSQMMQIIEGFQGLMSKLAAGGEGTAQMEAAPAKGRVAPVRNAREGIPMGPQG